MNAAQLRTCILQYRKTKDIAWKIEAALLHVLVEHENYGKPIDEARVRAIFNIGLEAREPAPDLRLVR